MTTFTTLPAMLAAQPTDAVAMMAPARTPLHYGQLAQLVDQTARQLRSHGLARADRVALVLDNGPEMACAFVAVASACTAAPLNAAYRGEEFAFYLTDLGAKALIVAHGSDSAAIAAAQAQGILVLELHADPQAGAGSFSLHGAAAPAAADAAADTPATASDVALILHTSGTTSRPKIVPLHHGNLCASARNISQTLQLTASDCGLHVMPMFHIHGLIAGVLAPMAVGSRIFCAPGRNKRLL
jgi:acyl-CoA synthetase (AMP-forming)/AMP-acid ligase II